MVDIREDGYLAVWMFLEEDAYSDMVRKVPTRKEVYDLKIDPCWEFYHEYLELDHEGLFSNLKVGKKVFVAFFDIKPYSSDLDSVTGTRIG